LQSYGSSVCAVQRAGKLTVITNIIIIVIVISFLFVQRCVPYGCCDTDKFWSFCRQYYTISTNHRWLCRII